ncbi:ABC transporter ATP-binding protein [Noviherbaspirillum denitrificans]|uniref:ABC transporter ATP-binding protein n=1 Tax=Noviherbaspirillum denitrificans TaxID=1968433 RepID=A0A254TCB3_9BURK|nr:ABC transporter ATP-binding protein [Noviherbaspirillum denitrificans]OWW20284.1 ABC transporter ATP-binding protein [Noviherbaspirillum denitrificans]
MPGPSSNTAAIETIHLSKRVADATGELTILRDIDFTVQAGETLAIVGASGSGKSTLLGLLAGLDTPSEGTVKLDGVDIFALSEDGRAGLRQAKLGFVFQSFQLLAHLTALENVMLPLELRRDDDARAKAEAMLGRVGLSSRLRHYPKYLSGGEQQRVALARAFVTEPPLLFADEPTGSLDAATGDAVIKLMFELNEERGSTLVLVTHDPSIAARCRRTITIAAGQLG